MAAVLLVRIKSRLETKEVERRLLERRPRFLEVPAVLSLARCRGRIDHVPRVIK